MGWPKLVESDLVRVAPIWLRSLNSTQGRLVMSSAVGNQPDLSTMHKPRATKAKAANREGGKWEKGEVRQRLINFLINIGRTDVQQQPKKKIRRYK
jgi:hypothetical protein